MKLRCDCSGPLILVAGFLVRHVDGALERWQSCCARRPAVGPRPNAANTAGFSTDEQNNIDIYKAAHEATVNITSIVYRESWFFQVYPGKDAGSGFIINPDGRHSDQLPRGVRRPRS